MAKPQLGTKRICPETGRKFYDLNKDPIVSPYTGTSYPLSYFESNAVLPKEEEVEQKELDGEEAEAEIVSLEEADDETAGAKEVPGLDDDDEEDVDIGDDEDTFLATDEDDDDVSGIIDVGGDDEEA